MLDQTTIEYSEHTLEFMMASYHFQYSCRVLKAYKCYNGKQYYGNFV